MTIRNYGSHDAVYEMNFCIRLSHDRSLRGIDKRMNAECYVLARDRAIVLGVDISGCPKSIGETDFQLRLLPKILRRIF